MKNSSKPNQWQENSLTNENLSQKSQENTYLKGIENKSKNDAEKVMNIVMNEMSKNQPFMDKSEYINKPININGYTVYVNTISKDGKILPYMLVYPENMQENSEIIVDTLNTNDKHTTNEKEDVFIQGADKIASFMRTQTKAPMLYVYCHRGDFVKEPYYQQLSKECFDKNEPIYKGKIASLVKDTIQDAQKRLANISGKKVDEKIVLNGYSTSGVFAQRFALIYPEIISKAIIGGAAGSIPIPSKDLDWPLGIKNFKEIFGREFNEAAYKKIQFAYYVGELEAQEKSENRKTENGNIAPMHDMSYLAKSIPKDIALQYRKKFGINFNDRFINAINWYKNNGYNIISKIYKEANHKSFGQRNYKYIDEYFEDLILFYKDGKDGQGFSKGKAGVEKIKTDYNKNVEEQILFSEQEIGKATINMPTVQKNKTAKVMQKDEHTIQEEKDENKSI